MQLLFRGKTLCCPKANNNNNNNNNCQGLPGGANTRKVKRIWILLKQETVSGSGISWAICKSAPRSRQITMPAPHHSVFYRPDAQKLNISQTELKYNRRRQTNGIKYTVANACTAFALVS